MMASRAPSRSKIGRVAARLRVMRVLAASPRSGWSAPIVSGRDAFELLRIWRVFESIGVALRATDENIDDPFYFDIHAVIAANERRKFLERSAEGMNRAAQRRPLYRRHRPSRLLVFQEIVAPAVLSPDDSLMWADLSAADVVRRIYHHLAIGRLDLSAYRNRVQLARHPHLLSP